MGVVLRFFHIREIPRRCAWRRKWKSSRWNERKKRKRRWKGRKKKAETQDWNESLSSLSLDGTCTFAQSKSEPLIRQTCNLEKRERNERKRGWIELCLSSLFPTLIQLRVERKKARERGSRSSDSSLRLDSLDGNRRKEREKKGKREEREREETWKREEMHSFCVRKRRKALHSMAKIIREVSSHLTASHFFFQFLSASFSKLFALSLPKKFSFLAQK